jgi:hypothetical protein
MGRQPGKKRDLKIPDPDVGECFGFVTKMNSGRATVKCQDTNGNFVEYNGIGLKGQLKKNLRVNRIIPNKTWVLIALDPDNTRNSQVIMVYQTSEVKQLKRQGYITGEPTGGELTATTQEPDPFDFVDKVEDDVIIDNSKTKTAKDEVDDFDFENDFDDL